MILADNVEKLTFNFSGKSYKVNRKQIEELYPNYDDIVSNEINKNNFSWRFNIAFRRTILL